MLSCDHSGKAIKMRGVRRCQKNRRLEIGERVKHAAPIVPLSEQVRPTGNVERKFMISKCPAVVLRQKTALPRLGYGHFPM
jgi:hypothetical protein